MAFNSPELSPEARAAAKAALDDAVAAYFAAIWPDEGGSLVTGYVLQIVGQTMTDMTTGRQSSYARAYGEQHPAMTIGLTTLLNAAAEGELLNPLLDDDED